MASNNDLLNDMAGTPRGIERTNNELLQDISANMISSAGTAEWGKISGDLTQQDDLESALTAKADVDDVILVGGQNTTENLIIGTNNSHAVAILANGIGGILIGTNGKVVVDNGIQTAHAPTIDRDLTPKGYVDNLVASVPGALSYQGSWDASTNTPTLVDGTGTNGDLYKVSTAGSQDLGSGTIVFNEGDHVVYDGLTWENFGAGEAVSSVNGKTGVVVLDKSDVGLSNVDNTSDLDKPISTATLAALQAKVDTTSKATEGEAVAGTSDTTWMTPLKTKDAIDQFATITRVSGTVKLQLDGEDLIWPSDIGNGKVRLWNGRPGSNNRFYGMGIDNITYVIQGDENVNFSFNKSNTSDARIELFRIANNGDVTATGDLHMAEKKVVNIANGTSARDAVNKQQLDAVSSTGTTANRPASPATGNMYFDTTLGHPIWYNGTAWVDATGTAV